VHGLRKFLSFMMILLSVIVVGFAQTYFRGQAVPLVLFILLAIALFIGGLVVHKKTVKD
jgi:hypothetical protein